MDDYFKLKLIDKIAKKKDPDFWENFDGDFDSINEMSTLYDFLRKYESFTNLSPIEETARIYELISLNYQNLQNGTFDRENFVNQSPKKYRVEYSQDYVERVTERGSNVYNAIDDKFALLTAKWEDSEGYFDFDYGDRDVWDSESITGIEFGDVYSVNESIKKSVKKALYEQYSIFIKKHK